MFYYQKSMWISVHEWWRQQPHQEQWTLAQSTYQLWWKKKKKKIYIYTQLSSDVQKCRGSFWQPEWPAVHSRLRTKNRSFHFIGTDHAHMNSFELSCVWGTIEWSLWLCLIQKQKQKEASVAHIKSNGRQPPHPPKACSLSDWFPPLNCRNNSPRSAQQSLDTG